MTNAITGGSWSRRFAHVAGLLAGNISAAGTINTRHSYAEPCGVECGAWLPQPRAYLRPSLTAVPRIDGAGRNAAGLRLVGEGVAGQELVQYAAERGSGIELGEYGHAAGPDTVDQQVVGRQVQLHPHAA
jgi:hypothetical protein